MWQGSVARAGTLVWAKKEEGRYQGVGRVPRATSYQTWYVARHNFRCGRVASRMESHIGFIITYHSFLCPFQSHSSALPKATATKLAMRSPCIPQSALHITLTQQTPGPRTLPPPLLLPLYSHDPGASEVTCLQPHGRSIRKRPSGSE